MTTRLIPDETRERLVKLLGMCGSDHDGEVTNAARMADQLVRQSGCVWADLIVMPRPEATHQRRPNGWRAMAIFCSARRDLLNVKGAGLSVRCSLGQVN